MARRAPIRIVHMGLGNFHRAHQAWYTARCPDHADWGIAAFTGRSPRAAAALAAQDGLYTLIERAANGDHAAVIASVSEAVDGADLARFTELMRARRTALLTLTVTEAGYRLDADGHVDRTDPAVRADLDALQGAMHNGATTPPAPTSTWGRLLLGLQQRHAAGGAQLAIVPCDNIPSNGYVVRSALLELATAVDASLARWISHDVAFVSTCVDRITPRTTTSDLRTAAQLVGWDDRCPVVTEPFSDWTLCGDFPAGRPDWEAAGARLVDAIEPFEHRKLWLLNGAHSLLAYLGTLHGHATVAAAIADPRCRARVETLWAEASRHLAGMRDLAHYCGALVQRFSNPRIEHRLAQIGMDGVAKLRARVVPVALAERAAGRDASGCAAPLAAWIVLARRGLLPADACLDKIQATAGSRSRDAVRQLVGLLDATLGADARFVATVATRVDELSR